MAEVTWDSDFVKTLKNEVVPCVGKSGAEAGQIRTVIDNAYLPRGIIGYAFAFTSRQRLVEAADKTGAKFQRNTSGPWKYEFNGEKSVSFEICCMYEDGQMSGSRKRDVEFESAQKRMRERQQISIFSELEPEKARKEFEERGGEYNMVVLVYNGDYTVTDIVLGTLVHAEDADVRQSWNFVNRVSLWHNEETGSDEPMPESTRLEDIADIALDPVMVQKEQERKKEADES